jgi:putative copper resistance protein D
VPTFLVLTRAIHFASCLLLESVFAVLFVVLLPVWRRSVVEDLPSAKNLARAFQWLLLISLAAIFLSGFCWLWLAIASMSGLSLSEALQLDLFRMVLTQTQPGQVWLIRAGLALAFAVTLPFLPGLLRNGKAASVALWSGALLATLLTASLAWLGHAGAGEGPQQGVQLAGDLVHLIAAGVWPGGLAPFAIALRLYLQAGDPTSLTIASAATRRFSTLSLVAVAFLALSGIVNSYFLVGTFHALVATDYGRLLSLKLVLFAAMIAIGAWNLLRLKPQLSLVEGISSGEAQDTALLRIKRNVLIEIVLGAIVLLVVGWLGILAPAVHS